MKATHARDVVSVISSEARSDETETLFVGLVRTYQQIVQSYVLGLTSDPQLAEDLTQDTFLRAYLALPAIGAPDDPRAWLLRIATNLTIDHMRRKRQLRWVSLGRVAHALRGRDDHSSLETAEPVRLAMASLRPDQQALLILFAHVGLKAPEVAEVLGITPAAARKRRQRAREAFTRAYRRESS